MVAGVWLVGGAGLGCGDRQRPNLTPGAGADTVGAGPGAGSGAGGHGAAGGAGGQGGAGGAQTPRGAAGVTLNDIVLYQGPARTLLKDRLEISDGPTIVAGRAALLRLFYQVDGGYDEEPVSVRVNIGEHSESQQLTLKEGTSSEADLSSTINFAIPKDILETDITIVVAIEQDGPDDNLAARYPTGDEDFTIAVADGHTMRVVIVPLRYDGDGSERLPDTSQARLDNYRNILMSMYPVRDINLTVRAPVPYGDILLPNNALTYQDLRGTLAAQRQLDAVDDDVYYYGVIQPTATQAEFCNAGCTAGTSFIAAESTPSQHVAVGLTWPDFDRVIAHELGHTLGRTHPGCDVIQEDLSYPHVNATLGGYGYDIVTQQLHPPSDFSIMSYCQPAFVSAYGWGLWYGRFVVVYGTAR